MAFTTLSAKKLTVTDNGNGPPVFSAQTGDKGATAAQATVAADIAVLVADGATPTQAHVTTLNTDYTALGPLGQTAQTGDVVCQINLANVTSISALRQAFNAILQAAAGNGSFTA